MFRDCYKANKDSFYIDIRKNKLPTSYSNPGIQVPVKTTLGEITKVNNLVNQSIKEHIYSDPSAVFSFDNWVYYSDKTNVYDGFHKHLNMIDLYTEGQWTWTFYTQTPDNLDIEEGHLLFELENGTIKKILPKVGDLLIFPSKVLHKPEPNKNTTKPRVVLCGNVCKLNLNHRYTKFNASLI